MPVDGAVDGPGEVVVELAHSEGSLFHEAHDLLMVVVFGQPVEQFGEVTAQHRRGPEVGVLHGAMCTPTLQGCHGRLERVWEAFA